MVAPCGDACMIGIIFGGTNFTHSLGVADFITAVLGDVVELDAMEGVSASNSLSIRSCGTLANALA